MRPENDPARVPTPVLPPVTGISPTMRWVYRRLRNVGFSRQDANLIMIGVLMACDHGLMNLESQPTHDA